MAAKANVVLKDHANADVTFSPRETVDGVTTYINTSGVPADERILTISMAKKKSAGGGRKAVVKLTLPVVQDMTVNGISKPTRVRVAYATLTLEFADTSVTTERQDMRKMLDALASATVFSDLLDNTDPPW